MSERAPIPPPVSSHAPATLARRRLAIFAFTAIVLLVTVIPPILWTRDQPTGGIAGMTLVERSRRVPPRVVVNYVSEDGPAQEAGLRAGDTLISVAGIPARDRPRLEALVLTAQAGQTLEYVVRRRDGEHRFQVTLMEFPQRGVLSVVLNLLVGAVFLIIGLFVAWRMPWDPRALVFHGMAISTAASMWVLPLIRLDSLMRGIVAEEFLGPSLYAMIFSGTFMGLLFLVLLLHFTLVFPRRAAVLDRHPALLHWPYAIPVAAIGMVVVGLAVPALRSRGPWVSFGAIVTGVLLVGWGWASLGRAAGSLRARLAAHPWSVAALAIGLEALFIAGFALVLDGAPRALRLAGIVAAIGVPMLVVGGFTLAAPFLVTAMLLRSYRASSLEERQQIRWPLWSIVVSMGGTVLAWVLMAFYSWVRRKGDLSNPWISDLYTLPFTLVIPVGFAVGILKYRLMDLDFVIRKTVIYAALSALMVVLYFAIVGGIGGWLVHGLGVQSTWLTVFGTLTVAAVFVPARNRIQGFIDRSFYRAGYEAAESLRRLGLRLAEAADARAVGRAVVEELHRTLHLRTVLFMAPDRDARSLVPVAAIGLPDEVVRTLRLPGDRPELPEPRDGGVIPVEQLSGPALATARIARAAAVVPVRRGNTLLGLMCIGGSLSDAALDEADRDYLGAVAGQAAVALSGLEAAGGRRELEEAREIQAGLLPHDLPRLAGIDIAAHWQPALQVAGDYYDVLSLGPERVALCIADVTGKGMPAALLMSNLQATVKSLAGSETAPRSVCERTNRAMAGALGPARFVTLFYGVLDVARRHVVYTNAGHNPPFLLRADGSVAGLDVGGILMGPMPDARYEEAAVDLASGDRLVLYTDGVTEAMNDAGELFGEERLVAALRAAEGGAGDVQRRILAMVTEHCGGVFQDDATLLVIAID